MSLRCFFLLLFLSVCYSLPPPSAALSSPYLSPATVFTNYQKMLKSFKIFIYTPPSDAALAFTSPIETLFFSLLQNSTFTTDDPEEAHLFFIPLPFSDLSARFTALVITELRDRFPYWNRTLGADHFLVACSGLAHGSDRNVVELKKNSVLVSCFPSWFGHFIPHKDVMLPALAGVHAPRRAPVTRSGGVYLAYARFGWINDETLVKTLYTDADILIESEPSDRDTNEERLAESRFCLFEYGSESKETVSEVGDALRFGCVPVVITDRPIQDLPLMDVLTWQKIALFVRSGGGVQELKSILSRTIDGRYEEMKGLCETASRHFQWNEKPQPYDAFHMVMYQLWLRRHTIRYVQRDWV